MHKRREAEEAEMEGLRCGRIKVALRLHGCGREKREKEFKGEGKA
ncbi:MAG: hypothetical protein N2V73_06270 [Candidatus Methanospirare jalkutatii]|nr:hypothetical protein [Candidatus Methanospirare jalkutatii]